MKKLMIMFVAAAITAVVQAGSVSWSTVAMFDATGAGTKVKDGAKVYVYLIANAEAYAAVTDIWSKYGADVVAGGANAANAGGSTTGKYTHKATVSAPNGTATANTTYYGAVIVTLGTGESMKYYAEKAAVTTGDDGNATYNIGGGTLDSATAAASSWATPSSGDVPEPTSGLLMLVGVAGLALRRKHK